jgi:tRNA pseudouridine55 synthase
VVFGLLNVNKPGGPTSHDIVAAVRRGTGERRVGHAGTLDPLAQGVLVLALGRATRLVEYLMASRKAYEADIRLGIETDTYDAAGSVTAERPVPAGLTAGDIEQVLAHFRGMIEQEPPAYSAVKVNGRAAYARARAGEELILDRRAVVIDALELTELALPLLRVRVECSAGTYIRSLAHDIGTALGCGAMLNGLVRTTSGRFAIRDAVRWDDLREAFAAGTWRRYLLPADLALDGAPQVRLSAETFLLVRNGIAVPDPAAQAGYGRAYDPDGQFVAVLEGDPEAGVWRPRKVLAPPVGAGQRGAADGEDV